MESEKKSLQQIITHRLEKLDKIRQAGHNPYPYNYDKTHHIKDLIEKGDLAIGNKVKIAGRIVSQRKMGKASFIHIQDLSGKIQVYLKNDILPGNIYDEVVRNLDLGDIVGCNGEIFITKTEEFSIKADNLQILSKNIRPLPNLKEKEGTVFNIFDDKELRYRHRQLDLIANPEVKNIFIKRAQVISSLRCYLDENGFIEVETPILQPIYGGASARPFTTYHNNLDQSLYLRIADELYLKRLIIGGFEKVYEIAKNFRNEGMDRNHNPEYTSLEYYQAYADVYSMMDLTENMFRYVAKITGELCFEYAGNNIDISQPFKKKTMFGLLQEYADTDISGMDVSALHELAQSKSLELPETMNYGQVLDKLFGEIVEPRLIEPTFVTDYPKDVSPLAKENRNGKTDMVERFELFIAGMEFANSFSELNDPIEQRKRLEAQALLREEGDEEAQVVDENFLQAMEAGMPPTGGVGIGVDRLIMLLTQQQSIKDVILFPAVRQEKIVQLTTRIAIRQLRSRHSFGFISFSTILSIVGLAIGIASLIIISCISRGFSDIVNLKLSGIDGHIRIGSYMSDRIPMSKIEKLDSSIYQILEDVKATTPYIEKHAIVKNFSFTEGIIVYGVPESALVNIFQLNQFTSGLPRFNNKKSIIIGSKLSESLNVKVGDNIMMLNVEKMAQKQILQAQNLTVANIFQTDFPEYDLVLGFIPIETADTFFEMDNTVSGLILNVNRPEYVELTDLKLAEEVVLYPYMTTTWKERHSGLLKWLTLYDIPIKLIMIFITAVGIFNIAASLWMIIIEKTRDFGIMKSMGLSANNIQRIILKEGAYIGLSGTFVGIVLSVLILYLQTTYQFITLSNDIYFMDYLPVEPSPIYFIIYPLCAFIITIAFSYYPSRHASKISPAKALHYE